MSKNELNVDEMQIIELRKLVKFLLSMLSEESVRIDYLDARISQLESQLKD